MSDITTPAQPSDLVQNPFSQFEDQIDGDIPTATLQIYQGIAEHLKREPDDRIDRASAATMCVRRRWYTGQGNEGKPLTPRKIVNFLLGDLAEKALLFFVRQSLVGPGKMYSEVDLGKAIGEFTFNGATIIVYEQKTLTWKISDEITVTAHVDGLGKRNSDGQWELIECKSASDYGYDDFKGEGPGDYLKQAHACMSTAELTALGVRTVRYYYLKKQTGHIWDRVFSWDQATADLVKAEYFQARGATCPDRPFKPIVETYYKKPTGRMILGFPCNYCNHVEKCFPEAKVEFKKGQFGVQKPVYVLEGSKDA